MSPPGLEGVQGLANTLAVSTTNAPIEDLFWHGDWTEKNEQK